MAKDEPKTDPFPYYIPAVGVFVFWGLTMYFAFPGFYAALCEQLKDQQWWVDNSLAFLVFGLMVSGFVAVLSKYVEKRERASFEGWHLLIWRNVEDKENPSKVIRKPFEEPIFWLEVEAFLSNELANQKFIKSVVSSDGGRLKTRADNSEPDSWLFLDRKNLKYIFDFTKETKEISWTNY